MKKPFLSRLNAEAGVALPVALAVLFVVAGLATVAARSGIVSNNQSFRDKNAKRAVQASNGGLQAAIYQTNLLQPASNECVVKDTSTGALSKGAVSSGWCTVQSEDLGDGATYQMQISSAGNPTYSSTGVPIVQRTVVATGVVNGVKRRSAVTVNAATGNPVFPPGYAIAVRDSVNLKNNANISGHLGSNGSITVKNNLDVCGNVTPGPGKTATIGKNMTQCSGYNTTPAAEPFDLQPVDISGPKASNDNVRLTNMMSSANPKPTPADTCSNCNKVSWSSTTRVLTIDGPGTVNMSGNTYLLCRLEVKNNATIQIPTRSTPLFIYIDTPENCGGGSGMGSVIYDGQLVNLYSPPLALAIMVAGSNTKATSVDLPSNDANSPIGIYAPNSTVTMKNNVNFTGAVVSKTLDVKNNANFTWHSSISALTSGSNVRFYQAATGSYKECTSAPVTSSPSDGC